MCVCVCVVVGQAHTALEVRDPEVCVCVYVSVCAWGRGGTYPLQRTAVHCNARIDWIRYQHLLQCVLQVKRAYSRITETQRTATHCNARQHIATHCNAPVDGIGYQDVMQHIW